MMSCFKCGDREVGCHARCEKYAAYCVENDAKKKAEHFQKEVDHFHYEAVLKSRHNGDKMEKKRKRGLVR